MRKVMIFGVFDGVHDGHRHLFAEAKRHGDFLIAAVARDAVVQRLKGHMPRTNFAERLKKLGEESLVDAVVPGDEELGRWRVIAEHRPDVIVLGYDQDALKANIEPHIQAMDRRPKMVVAEAYRPGTHHSGILFPRE